MAANMLLMTLLLLSLPKLSLNSGRTAQYETVSIQTKKRKYTILKLFIITLQRNYPNTRFRLNNIDIFNEDPTNLQGRGKVHPRFPTNYPH